MIIQMMRANLQVSIYKRAAYDFNKIHVCERESEEEIISVHLVLLLCV